LYLAYSNGIPEPRIYDACATIQIEQPHHRINEPAVRPGRFSLHAQMSLDAGLGWPALRA
jgi:hypothetical protein